MQGNVHVDSELGKLKTVIIHTPGTEVENMTPQNAERALYSDILNLKIAIREYSQLSGVLNKVSEVWEITNLLKTSLENTEARKELISSVSGNNNQLRSHLEEYDSSQLTTSLIEGELLKRDNLTRYLSKEKFELRPLHNFFFTRDSSMVINDSVLIGTMASKVRQREALIMKTIFRYHPELQTIIHETGKGKPDCSKCTIEGGDLLMARKDVVVIGNGCRTSTEGIDSLIEIICRHKTNKFHIIVQELPYTPESFIHLDMVFTLLDRDSFMAYEPLILKKSRFQTVHIEIDNGRVTSIRDEISLPSALSSLGMDMKPVICGGVHNPWVQEREQWHSGANFLAIAPGKLLGYSRNEYTMEEMSKQGYEILNAEEVINGKSFPENYKRCVIGIDGSELSRGGGGARCMTMPVSREPLIF